MNTLLLGTIHIDGMPGNGSNAGGGSAGALILNAHALQGHGVITANGGKGQDNGGGGSGGRIFIKLQERYVCDCVYMCMD